MLIADMDISSSFTSVCRIWRVFTESVMVVPHCSRLQYLHIYQQLQHDRLQTTWPQTCTSSDRNSCHVAKQNT